MKCRLEPAIPKSLRSPLAPVKCIAAIIILFNSGASPQSTIKFTDITTQMNVPGYLKNGITAYGHGCAMADINGDSLPDIYASNAVRHAELEPGGGLLDFLYLSHKDGPYTEHATERHVDDRYGWTGSHGIIFFDYNNDGLYDIFNATTDDANRLYKNLGNGWYDDVSGQAGIPAAGLGTRGLVAVDINRDGWLDLYGVNWGPMETPAGVIQAAPPQPNELYINNGDGTFTTEPRNGARGLTFDNPENVGTQGVSAIDIDNDGDMDIFVCRRNRVFDPATNSTMYEPTSRIYNQLFINNGKGFFKNETVDRGLADASNDCNGTTFADYDNDGDLDAFVVPNDDSDVYGGKHTRIYNNDGTGHFTKIAKTESALIGWGFSAILFDADNDGDLDFFIGRTQDANLRGNGFYTNDGTGKFTEVTTSILSVRCGDPRGAAVGDIDNDGDLDLYMVDSNKQLYTAYHNYLFRNDSQNNNRWLKVYGRGPKGDMGAFGTKIWLFDQGHMDDMTHLVGYRQIQNGYAYLCQDDPVQHFGLGLRDKVDLKIMLLDSTVLKAFAVAANQRIFFSKSGVSVQLAGIPNRLAAISGSNQSGSVNQILPLPISLQVLDYASAPAGTAQVQFTVVQGGGRVNELDNITIPTNPSGIASVNWRLGTGAGTAQKVRAVVLGYPLLTTEFTATAQAGAAALLQGPENHNFSGIVGKILPPISFHASDTFQNPVANAEIAFAVTSGGGQVNGAEAVQLVTDSQGSVAIAWRLGAASGSQNNRLTVTASGLSGSPMVLTASAAPDRPYRMIRGSGGGQSGAPGAILSQPLTVIIQDSLANPIASHPVLFAVTHGDAFLSGAVSAQAMTDSLGMASAQVTLGGSEGSVTISCEARYNGAALQNAPVLFQLTAFNRRIDPARSALSLSAATAVANGRDEVTVRFIARDAQGLALPGMAILFAATGENNILQQSDAATGQDGSISGTLRSTRSQTKRIWAAADGAAASHDTLAMRFIAGPPAQLLKSSGDQQQARAKNRLPLPLVVQVQDQFDNPVREQPLLIAVEDPSAQTEPSGTTFSDSLGRAALIWRLGDKPEQKLEITVPAVPGLLASFSAHAIANQLPAIICPQDTTLKIGATLNFRVIVSDADGDPVTLAASALPPGAEFTAQSGLFTWTPRADQAGDRIATFVAQDSAGGVTGRSVTIHVLPSNRPPYFTAVVPVDSVLKVAPGSSIRFQIQAIDPDDDYLGIQWQFNGLSAGSGQAITVFTSKPAIVAVEVGDGIFSIEHHWRIEIISGIETDPLPTDFALMQNYPNPANPGTTISFSLPRPDHVRLIILNQTGQCVATLVEGMTGAGTHRIYWNARDQEGNPLPSGLYLYELQAGGLKICKKLLLVK